MTTPNRTCRPKMKLEEFSLASSTHRGCLRLSSLVLVLAAPITTWDEAVPLGNGLLGGLLWGEGNTVRLSLAADPVGIARDRVASALAAGYEKMIGPHRAYWADFWAKSSVRVPEADILRHYYLVQYFYGAASRRGSPPMPLQGVWTADAGGLPPWKGDYHNDLNTQMTYIAYQAACTPTRRPPS